MVSHVAILALGFIAQGLFGLRMLVQWVALEKKKSWIAPTLFWQISLLASLLFLVYGVLRYDAVIVAGQLLTYYIYVRNLQVKNEWLTIHKSLRIIFMVIPVVSLGWVVYQQVFTNEVYRWEVLSHPMMIIGFAGQLILNLRFVYQWFYLEKNKESVLPRLFWILSLIGSVLVLVYAFNHPQYKIEPVLILAQSLALVVYIRNLMVGKL
jgi:lipid-A-disaccharide synthase-like uncharacterized protein